MRQYEVVLHYSDETTFDVDVEAESPAHAIWEALRHPDARTDVQQVEVA